MRPAGIIGAQATGGFLGLGIVFIGRSNMGVLSGEKAWTSKFRRLVPHKNQSMM